MRSAANSTVETAQTSTEVSDWPRGALFLGECNPGKRLLASLSDYQRLEVRRGGVASLRKERVVLRHRIYHLEGGLIRETAAQEFESNLAPALAGQARAAT